MFKTILTLIGIIFSYEIHAQKTVDQIDNKEMVTLHFTADNRVPYKVGVPFISYGTFAEAVQGLLIETSNTNLPDFKNLNSSLEFAEPVNNDPSLIHIKLKKDLYFDDGENCWQATADDVKFSLARFFFTDFEINAKHQLSNIFGTENIKPGTKYKPELLDSIKIINKYELTVKLKKIDPTFIEKISHAGTPLVSIKTLKENYFSWKKWPIGVGSYKVIFSNPITGETVIEMRKDSKFLSGPKYIRFVSSKSNEGDIFWKDMWNLDSKKFKKEILNVSYGTLGIFFNFDSTLGSNENFRKAVSLIINRDELVKGTDYLVKNSEIIPVSIWGRAEINKKQNIEIAKKYLKKVPDHLLNSVIEINTFGQNAEAIDKSNFKNLKTQLEQLGLKIKFKLDDGNLKLDSPMYIVGIQAIHKDPSYVFAHFRHGSFYKNGYPKNDRYIEENFNKFMISKSYKDKLLISKALSNYLTEKAIVVPLWDLLSVYFYDSQKIDIATFHSQPGGMKFKVWEIKTIK